MLGKTDLQRPFESQPTRAGAPSFDQLEDEARRDASERRRTAWLVLLASAFHLGLLFVAFPEIAAAPAGPPERGPVFVVESVRFKPRAPRPERRVPERKVKRIPIPDPTPDDPEPIAVETEVEVRFDLDLGDQLVLDIPTAPPGPGPASGGAAGAIQMSAGIVPPRRLHAPQPPYTEAARAARIQGTVVLQAVVTAAGEVIDVRILKGLPHGLADSAVETMRSWRYEPATRDGEPVAVFYNFTINFSLQ